MTRTSPKLSRLLIAACAMATIVAVSLSSCKKNDPVPHGNSAAAHSAEVVDKWMTLQIRLMSNGSGVPNQAYSRHFAYSGIAALESIVPGLPGYAQQFRKWNGLSGLPVAAPHVRYYYPANVNAALAAMNRSFFPNANATDKAAIDSLENALKQSFLNSQSADIISKSADFGKAVATAVFNWAETDNYKNGSNPYTPPVGPGLWKPTAENGVAASPYWGNNRPVMIGSLNNTSLPAPVAYSTEPSSDFYKMAKQVHDVCLAATPDQKAAVHFWRDVPGVTSPGHFLSITKQVINQKHAKLDKAVLAYALTGSAINDALIACWKAKYQYNLLRPITYIREVMGVTSWNTVIPTPQHPDYPSGHSVLAGAGASTLEKIFGNVGSFTDHTYDYMGLTARSYTSLDALAVEGSMSRIWGGIHFLPALELGLAQGKKVTANIFDKPGSK